MTTRTYKNLTQFTVPVPNQPGQLAAITDLLTGNGLNITGIQAQITGMAAFVSFVTDSEPKAVEALLTGTKLPSFQTQVVAVRIPNQPGRLGKIVNALSKAGLNIDTIYGTTNPGDDLSTVVISVESPANGVQTIDQVLERLFASVPVSA